ncbi:hypothetical protein [Anaerotignum propionicum]|uniref:hypothetical protein n=1 Tax=Anaerotignum propionicum TaxID=28446 RepID=UPI00289E730F|nr:hypothetical protein [Anaerotignum propionicum]
MNKDTLMKQVHDNKFFRELLNDYNQAFYDKDIDNLKQFYDTDTNVLIYLDNHKGNDTYCLDEHLHLISDFFENGKSTESGGVEPLMMKISKCFIKLILLVYVLWLDTKVILYLVLEQLCI